MVQNWDSKDAGTMFWCIYGIRESMECQNSTAWTISGKNGNRKKIDVSIGCTTHRLQGSFGCLSYLSSWIIGPISVRQVATW